MHTDTNLGDEAVEVGVGRALDVEVAAAHVVEGLVVQAEGHIGVFEEGVGRQHSIVRLHDGVGNLGWWVARGQRDTTGCRGGGRGCELATRASIHM